MALRTHVKPRFFGLDRLRRLCKAAFRSFALIVCAHALVVCLGIPSSSFAAAGPSHRAVSAHVPAPPPANLIHVEGGTLRMSMGEETLSAFLIGRYEVSWGEWKAVRSWASDNGYDLGDAGAGCADDHPVHSVTWFDVIKWCNARSEMEALTPVYMLDGKVFRRGSGSPEWITGADGYRLPGEAEWEFAARGGTAGRNTDYSGGDVLDEVGWFWDNSSGAPCDLSGGRGTWPVGRKEPNELGLYDMSGNVWEWCWDEHGGFRRMRGGSWDPAYGPMAACKVSHRDYAHPAYRRYSIGFRLARGGH